MYLKNKKKKSLIMDQEAFAYFDYIFFNLKTTDSRLLNAGTLSLLLATFHR